MVAIVTLIYDQPMAKPIYVSNHLTAEVSARLRKLQLGVSVKAGRRTTLSELVDSLMDYAEGRDDDLARLILQGDGTTAPAGSSPSETEGTA